jgi:predicted regulator of Ras-like GTPase activity (Roadblock/LC7/MglB family)
MLGSLKKLFFKDTGEDLATSIPEPVAVAPAREWPKVPTSPAPVAATIKPAAPITPAPVNDGPTELLSLSLQVILSRLPNSLASIVQSQGNGFVSLPANKIVRELSKGSVKIPFGELRHAAPPGTFFDNARLDQVLVELPLEEILARLHPSHLSRRPGQKEIQIPADITNVFGPHGEGISLGASQVGSVRTAAPKPATGNTGFAQKATGNTAFAQKAAAPASKQGDTSLAVRVDTSFRTRTMPPVTPSNIFSSPTAVVPPPQVDESVAAEPGEPVIVPLTLLCESWPELVRVDIRELNLSNRPVAVPLEGLGDALRTGKIIFRWKQICAWMQPPIDCTSAAHDLQVELPLKIMAPLFMAKHRSAKAQKKVTVAEIPDLFAMKPAATEMVAPEPVVQPAVAEKSAAPVITPISFSPSQAPVVPVTTQSATPRILPTAPNAAPSEPISVHPKLTMKAESSIAANNVTPLPKPAEPQPAKAEEPKVEVAPASRQPVAAEGNSIGAIFNQPARTDWPPAEVLKQLIKLPGVEGAFLAMTDGLLVAAELPPQYKAEMFAAFLPQIFGRMNQYSKELQLGGLSSLTFVVNHVPWQIVKSGGIYLVALAKPGENLPSAKLDVVASELGKQIQ